MKFITGCYRQILGETISKNIRKEMYEHIQNLSYSYHNNVDTGDLIQRCTTDNEVIKNFLSMQLPEVVSTFAISIKDTQRHLSTIPELLNNLTSMILVIGANMISRKATDTSLY